MTQIPAGDGPLTDDQRHTIRQRLADCQAATGLSSAAIAKTIGLARTTYAAVVKGSYPHNMDPHLRRIAAWIREQSEREPAPGVAYAETSVARRILSACHRAAEMPTIAVIMAPAGIGKTVALEEFASRRRGRSTIIRAGQDHKTVPGIRHAVATALGVPRGGSVAEHSEAIRARLAGYYAGGASNPYCILIDEATTLTPSAIDWLRNLHDDPRCRTALVLADTWRFDAALNRADGIRGGAEQLWRRAGAQVRIGADEPVSAADVDRVTDTILRSIGHDPAVLRSDARRFLRRVAQQPGKLGNIHQRLQAVADCAAGCNIRPEFTAAQLDFVADMLGCSRTATHNHNPFEAADSSGDRRPQAAARRAS